MLQKGRRLETPSGFVAIPLPVSFQLFLSLISPFLSKHLGREQMLLLTIADIYKAPYNNNYYYDNVMPATDQALCPFFPRPFYR